MTELEIYEEYCKRHPEEITSDFILEEDGNEDYIEEIIKVLKARENARRYYQKNKQKVLNKQKEYIKKKYATDKNFREKCYKRSRKYVENNIEKIRESKRKWARKHYQELIEKGLRPPTQKMQIEKLQQEITRLNKDIKILQNMLIESQALCDEYIEKYNNLKTLKEDNNEIWIKFKKESISK